MTATKRKSLTTRLLKNKMTLINPPSSNDSSSSAEENVVTPGEDGPNLTITRKTNKPLMEKRRRARINQSLTILKDLVVLESDNPSKLEKADILELTVSRVRDLCNLKKSAHDAFQDGYNKCLETASQFLMSSGLGHLNSQLLSHVTSSLQVELLSVPQHLPEPPAQDLLNEPIDLAILSSHTYRDYCSVWRPW